MTADLRVRLPDGRLAVAGLDDPIAVVMRRVLAAHACSQRAKNADYATITAWLDEGGPA